MKKWHLFIFLFACPAVCILAILIWFLFSLLSELLNNPAIVSSVGPNATFFVLFATVLNTFLTHIPYFFSVSYLWDKKRLKNFEAILFYLSFPALTAAGYVILGIVSKAFSLPEYVNFVSWGIGFEIACGLLIFGTVCICKLFLGKRSYTFAITLWSALILGIFVVATYCFGHSTAVINSDFWGIFTWLFPVAFLALYSVLIGRAMTKRLYWVKMVIWYLGLVVAMFFGSMFWSRIDLIYFWKYMVPVSAAINAAPIWGFAFIGFGLSRIQTGKTENKE